MFKSLLATALSGSLWARLGCFLAFTFSFVAWGFLEHVISNKRPHLNIGSGNATLARPRVDQPPQVGPILESVSNPDGPQYHAESRLSYNLDLATRISNHSLTGILPISPESVGSLHEVLRPFLKPVLCLQDVILLGLGISRSMLAARLQEVLTSDDVQKDHPDFSLRTWDQDAPGPLMLEAVKDISTPYLLVMDQNGLQAVDAHAQALLTDPVEALLPFGPSGAPMRSPELSMATPGVSVASYLTPPFVMPRSLLPRGKSIPDNWQMLGVQVALCNPHGIGGILIDSRSRELRDAISRRPGSLASAPTTIPAKLPSDNQVSRQQRHSRTLQFTFLLATASNVQQLSSLLCALLSVKHELNILVVETEMRYSFNPIRHKTRIVINQSCTLPFFTVNHFMPRKEISSYFKDLKSSSHVVITLEPNNLSPSFMGYFVSRESALINLPQEDLAYCDWMSSFSFEEWKSWHTPRIDVTVITRDRPQSLSRLLQSLSRARYFGDKLDLRLNVEQDCDYETLDVAQNYKWTPGSLFIHRRIIHAGLLPAVVESWYPRTNDTYGLLLEDDVELSPLFYAWAKMSILKYGKKAERSPKLFGISLYQQKNIELRLEGRVPFNARSLFTAEGLPHPSTPYLSQVPCSWGAVYFPEHWREFHDYLTLRFSEAWIPIDDVVAPSIRSNNWLKSWKKFFIELVYLKGYVMLYPNFHDFVSLSTNHLELGSHVKVRSREKQELFELPLMGLPLDGAETGLLDLPERMLPAYRDLPVLNLTAAMSSMDSIVQVGGQRSQELCTSRIEMTARHSIHNFICAQSNVPILQ